MQQWSFRWLSGVILSDLPPFAIALVIGELFFKFGSFALEAIAFVALWRALAWVSRRIREGRG